MQSDSRINRTLDIEVYIIFTLAQFDTCVCKNIPPWFVSPIPFKAGKSKSSFSWHNFLLITMNPISNHHPLGDANVYLNAFNKTPLMATGGNFVWACARIRDVNRKETWGEVNLAIRLFSVLGGFLTSFFLPTQFLLIYWIIGKARKVWERSEAKKI